MKPDLIQKAVAEFMKIYKQEYGVELSDKEATVKATSLLQLFEVLTRQEGKEVR